MSNGAGDVIYDWYESQRKLKQDKQRELDEQRELDRQSDNESNQQSKDSE